jgi:hypothetical protein
VVLYEARHDGVHLQLGDTHTQARPRAAREGSADERVVDKGVGVRLFQVSRSKVGGNKQTAKKSKGRQPTANQTARPPFGRVRPSVQSVPGTSKASVVTPSCSSRTREKPPCATHAVTPAPTRKFESYAACMLPNFSGLPLNSHADRRTTCKCQEAGVLRPTRTHRGKTKGGRPAQVIPYRCQQQSPYMCPSADAC